LSSSKVEHKVDAATNGDAKLAFREEEGCKIIGKKGGDDGASDATPGSTDADGA
jgi:hypothetical protein